MVAQESSWAKLEVFAVTDDKRELDKEAVVRVGGDESGQTLDAPIYQVPFYQATNLWSIKAYVFRLTLLNGTLTFDFARCGSFAFPHPNLTMCYHRSQSAFFNPTSFLQPLSNDTRQRANSNREKTLITILVPTFILITALALCYFARYRYLAKRHEKARFVGEPARFKRDGSSLAAPVPFDTALETSTHSYRVPTSGIRPDDPASARYNAKSRVRGERWDYDMNSSSSNSSAAALVHNGRQQQRVGVGQGASERSSSDLASEGGTQSTGLEGSLLFSGPTTTRSTSSYLADTTSAGTTSTARTAHVSSEPEADEPAPMMLTHEDLAVVFQRATELRNLHDSTNPDDLKRLEEGRQREQLEVLACQLAGVS